MRLAVIGETRHPVLPDGPGGLGRSTHDVATGLAQRGHDVTLFAMVGSEFEDGKIVELNGNLMDIKGNFNAWFDYTHMHGLSRNNPALPILNCIGDSECEWQPPNAIVATKYMTKRHPTAKVIKFGIDIDGIPFYPKHKDYLFFMSIIHKNKGPQDALDVARKTGKKIIFAGPPLGRVYLPNYLGAIKGDTKWHAWGNAYVYLAPYIADASPRSPLEAAALGVPILCYDLDGTQEHLCDGVSGFVCNDIDDMASKVGEIEMLDRFTCREWVKEEHNMDTMLDDYESLLADVAGGARW